METSEFGNGDYEISAWPTPFENADIELIEVSYCPSVDLPEGYEPGGPGDSLLESDDEDLVIRVYVYQESAIYRLAFVSVSAFRVLEEGGLLQFWEKSSGLVGRPGRTSFRVRNHRSSKECLASFVGREGGWSFVIATENACVEVVAAEPPTITREAPSA